MGLAKRLLESCSQRAKHWYLEGNPIAIKESLSSLTIRVCLFIAPLLGLLLKQKPKGQLYWFGWFPDQKDTPHPCAVIIGPYPAICAVRGAAVRERRAQVVSDEIPLLSRAVEASAALCLTSHRVVWPKRTAISSATNMVFPTVTSSFCGLKWFRPKL